MKKLLSVLLSFSILFSSVSPSYAQVARLVTASAKTSEAAASLAARNANRMAKMAAMIGFFVDGPQNLAGGVQASRVTVSDATSAACGFTGMFGYFGAMLSSKGASFISVHYGWKGVYMSGIVACVIAMACIATTWKKEAMAKND